MKNLIPIIIVILSMNLFAQKPHYWEKIDFVFDSGIKIIDYYEGFTNSNPLIIATDRNQIVYYQFYYRDGLEIDNSLIVGDIKDAHIIKNDSLTLILILTENNTLYMSRNLGEIWDIIDSVTNVATIYPERNLNYMDEIVIITKINGDVLISYDYCISWENINQELKQNMIKQLFVSYLNVHALTDDYKIYTY
jgi:hypothetical protein